MGAPLARIEDGGERRTGLAGTFVFVAYIKATVDNVIMICCNVFHTNVGYYYYTVIRVPRCILFSIMPCPRINTYTINVP